MKDKPLQVVELSVSPADQKLLERLYGDLYVPEFPNANERESLANIKHHLGLKESGWYGRNTYHVTAMFDGECAVGLAIFDYLFEANAGIIEFLVVSAARRGCGHGGALLSAAEASIRQDARKAGRELVCIAAEINDPFVPHSLDDNLDPFLRAKIWDNWGYRRLDFPYVQPALSVGQQPVRNLLLAAKPFAPDTNHSMPPSQVEAIVREYMRWAMRIDDPSASREYLEMDRMLRSVEKVALQPLGAYVGFDRARPLFVREVTGRADPDLRATLAVYAEAFPAGAANIDTADFIRFASAESPRDVAYHLWSVRGDVDGPVEGMASFFSFARAGFGGYVAFSHGARGTGRFALLLARCEEQMRRDAPEAPGWYIECDPAKVPFFAHFGFYAVDIQYRQPPLRPDGSDSPDLTLMFKEFGRRFCPPRIERNQFLSALADIFRVVYGADASESRSYRDMYEQAGHWAGEAVLWR